MPAVPLPEDAPERRELKPHEERALKKAQAFSETGRGYAIMHETRPGKSIELKRATITSLSLA